MKQFGVQAADINVIIYEKPLAAYFENVVSELEAWAGDTKELDWDIEKSKLIKSAAGWLTSKLMKLLIDEKKSIKDTKVDAENFAELIKMLHLGEINSTIGQKVLQIMHEKGGDPSTIVDDNDWGQMSDAGDLADAIKKAIDNNPGPVKDYKSGKENAIQFLLGQVMKETQGKANPKTVIDLLTKSLS